MSMQMYHKFMIVLTMAAISLLLIFAHLDWRRDSYDTLRTKSLEFTSDYPENSTLQASEDSDSDSGSLKFEAPSAAKSKTASSKNHEKSKKSSSSQKSSNTPEQENDKDDSESPTEPIQSSSQSGFTNSYPDWFTKGWSRTSTAGQRDVFVGDKALFPACSTSSDSAKTKFIEPKKYLPNSKNPCWYEDSLKKNTLRCLPYFFVAGVAKCGTTDIYRRIRLHGSVMKGTMKEYHFWDRERFGNVDISQNGDILKVRRKPWTFKQYTDAVAGDRDLALLKDDLKYSGNSTKIFGDGSPSYFWDVGNWKLLAGNEGCKEPRVTIGQHIRHIFPAAKTILLFRHPTPRLYSRFLSRMWRTSFLKDATSETFHNYVVKGVRMYRECFKRWSIRHCAYNSTLYDDAVIRLVEGMYPVFMADWLRIWPKEQMLLLRSEDYGKNVTKTMETVFEYLVVGPPSEEDRAEIMGHQMVNVGAEYDKVGPMRPETVKILDEFYQPFVDQFAEMLQDRRFLWKDVYPPASAGGATKPVATEGKTAADRQEIGDTKMMFSPSQTPEDGASDTDKPLPLWAKLLLKIRPSAQSSSSKNGHQSEEAPIMRIENPAGVPIKKARYPAWWVNGWPKSATSGLGDQFLGDQPFFAPCTSRSHNSGKVYSMLQPRKYEQGTKNPCWYKDPQLSDSLRCLPYFYIAGVAKSGTSDLYRRLRMHPDIMKGSMKEYHWWDRGRFGDFYSDDLPIKADKPEGMRIPFKQYMEMISGKQGITAVVEDLNKTGKSVRIFGDHSPSYFNDVKYWSLLDGNQGCNEPRVTIGQHIGHMTPNAKIIVVVRHPTPRSYLRFLARVPEKVSVRKEASFAFHRLVKKSVNMYKGCFDRWSVRHCAYNTTLYQKDKVKLWEGMYSVFLWDWLRVFPRQQILVIRYRDLIRDTRSIMTQLFRFLELPPLNETTMRSLVAEKWLERREEHELKKYFGAMVPETVDMLNDFYEPFVDKFAETLNDERFLWRDSDHL